MQFGSENRGKVMMVGGAAGLFVLGIGLIWILTSWIISPDGNEFYVLISRTGSALPPGKILAEPGQAGIQKELHASGWAVYNPITWDYERHKMTIIPAGQMGILTAQDGEPLPAGLVFGSVLDGSIGEIKKCHKGMLEQVLMPGSYRIHPHWFKIEMKTAITIEPGSLGVVTALTGKPMPQGQILSDDDQQGTRRKILMPGTYYMNPYAYKIETHKAVQIEPGYVGVVTALTGKEMTEGEILASEGQRGIQANIYEPGTYYVNPYEYKVDRFKAVEVPSGSVGIVTAQMGKPMAHGQLLAKDGERGVRERVLEAGLYFLNPYAVKIDSISLRSHRLDLMKDATHDDDIEFPSSDGFDIRIDAAVEWRIKSDKVSEVFLRLGDEKAILDNVIRPNARSISRIEGSKYKATDFISGTNREKFETSFITELGKVCEAKGIEIMRALVRKITVPDEISKPIREAEVARQEKLRNIEQIETQKSSAQLAKEKALVEQQTKQIDAETQKIVKETEAKQMLSVAEIALQTAEKEAQANVTRGKAEADVIQAKKKAEAEGFRALVEAFGGGPNYAMYNFTQMVAQHTTFVFAPVGEGTFWTDPQAFFKMAGAKALQDKDKKTDK